MSETDRKLPKSDRLDRPRTIGFLLVADFSLMSYASAVEPLRAANILAGAELYRWRNVSTGEEEVQSSNGLSIRADHKIGEAPDLDALLICAGGNPALFDHRPTFRWLSRLGQKPIAIGGVSGGPWLLARAGQLEGHACTIHWEHAAAFAEAFPHLDLRRTLFEIDRDRMTCAGGIAALDMMTALIARQHGQALGRAVGAWFLRAREREGGGPQRPDPGERHGIRDPHLGAALRAMENRVESPLSRRELATIAGVGVRQLERLFAEKFTTSVGRHYLAVRLDRARNLVHETELPIIEIAMACGFVSASHFSRGFSARFGASPRAARARSQSPGQDPRRSIGAGV